MLAAMPRLPGGKCYANNILSSDWEIEQTKLILY